MDCLVVGGIGGCGNGHHEQPQIADDSSASVGRLVGGHDGWVS